MSKGRFLLVLAVVVAMCGAASQARAQETYTVTNTNDSGDGSLRWAIEQANSHPGPDSIDFSIPGGGVHTISPSSALPTVTDPVIVDGLSQGTSCDSWPPTTLLIELDGSGISATTNGLWVAAGGSGSTIRGLIINRFTASGIRLDEGGSSTITCNYIGTDSTGLLDLGNTNHGVFLVKSPANTIAGNLISGNGGSGVRIDGSAGTATGNLVQGNYIGLQVNGTGQLGNGYSGVYLLGTGASNNTIGGMAEEARNVISGNNLSGVSIFNGAAGNVVQGNYMGTQANGAQALSNTWSGVYIENAPDNLVGGATEEVRNILSGNVFYGVYIGGDTATGNLVQGNFIGTGVAGTESLGNGRHGVYIRYDASENQVGGSSENEGNLIVYNSRDGVCVESGTNNLVSGNSISSNDGLGIDLGPDGVTANDPGDSDSGANNLQNFPELTSITIADGSTTIQGTLDSVANTVYTLEFFYSVAADPTIHGEGAVFFGSHQVTTGGTGPTSFAASFPIEIPKGSFVSSTATDPDNNTSEFSQIYEVPTAVELVDFSAYPVAQGIMLEWTTAVEIENLGFNLYRGECAKGDRTKLNDTLIPVQAPGLPMGAHYTWKDDAVFPGITYCYWLEDVSVYGNSSLHGPVFGGPLPYKQYLPLLSR